MMLLIAFSLYQIQHIWQANFCYGTQNRFPKLYYTIVYVYAINGDFFFNKSNINITSTKQ